MASFDYSAFAELYPSRNLRSHAVRYRRFDNAAEALRYVMEELPKDMRRGTTLEVGDDRYESAEIERLYNAAGYPLSRAAEA